MAAVHLEEPDTAKPVIKLPPENAKPARKFRSSKRAEKAHGKNKTILQGKNSVTHSSMVLTSGITAMVNEVDLTVGRAKVIDLKVPAARVALSDPEVATAVIISPTQIQLIGKKIGVANLLLWDDNESSRHTIIDIAVHRDVSVLSKQLKFIDPSLHAEPMAADDSVILTGDADSIEAAQLAVELAKAFFVNSSSGTSTTSSSSSGGSTSSSTSTTGQNISSLAPGTSLPFPNRKVINMIKVKGQPTTKIELARKKVRELDPNIQLDVIPGPDGEKVILTGRVKTSGIIAKAINTAGIFYGQPGMKVITGPGGKLIRQGSGTTSFQDAESFNDNLDINVLQGSVVTDATGNVISMLEVAQRPQVRCNIKFLTVQRSTLAQLGGSLLGNRRDLAFGNFSAAQIPATGKTIATSSGSSSVTTAATSDHRGVPNPLSKSVVEAAALGQTLGGGITQAFIINQTYLAAISALEEKRKLRSLAEPNITVLSGEKAGFLAGGEVPIPVLGTNGQISITYHEFGIRLNVIPTVTDDGKVNLQVAPEVSTVDPTISITTNLVTVPGFATRRMQTTMDLENGQSLILAGLFSQEENDALSKFPGIGSLPIIGTFFSGKNQDRRNNEMIVIIRPEIVMVPDNSPAPMIQSNDFDPKGKKLSKEILGFADTK